MATVFRELEIVANSKFLCEISYLEEKRKKNFIVFISPGGIPIYCNFFCRHIITIYLLLLLLLLVLVLVLVLVLESVKMFSRQIVFASNFLHKTRLHIFVD